MDACEQSIQAYKEFTGMDGEKGALKDVVDPDWYLVKYGPMHVGEDLLRVWRPGEEEDD